MLAGTFRQQKSFLNSIRFLANDLRLQLLCVGAMKPIRHCSRTSNWQTASQPFVLPRWHAVAGTWWQDDAVFAQLLITFASILPPSVSVPGCGRTLGHFGRSSRSFVPSSAIQIGCGPASVSGPDSSRTARERHFVFSNRNGTPPLDRIASGCGLPLLNPAGKSWSFRSAGRADSAR
jgi:hypothetical protein